MKILYVGNGSKGTTSAHRMDALQRLGHQVQLLDPYASMQKRIQHSFWGTFHYRTGFRFIQSEVKRWLYSRSQQIVPPDIIWVNSGELMGKESLQILKTLRVPIVLYNNDDPMGNRDGQRFKSLQKALPIYDLCVVRMEKREDDFFRLGAQHILKVWMSYDEVAHAPYEKSAEIPEEFRSDITFVGTWIRAERRELFMEALVKEGLPLKIWGARWDKSTVSPQLRASCHSRPLCGRDYVAALQGAYISLGLLSKSNGDGHTRRSVEIPYAGGLLCGERTPEHLKLYRDGEEAVFWDDSRECISHCTELLSNPDRREQIRLAGMAKVRQLKVGNEDICRQILEAVTKFKKN